jgi:hypothetical protein
VATNIISDAPHHPVSSFTSHPALRWDVQLSLDETMGDAVFLRDEAEYRFTGISGETICQVVARLDGIKAAFAIAAELGLPLKTVETLCERLIEFDLAVSMESSDEAVSPQKFSSTCRFYFPRWKNRLFGHALWRQLATGEAARGQFIGWLLESYHFIEGVNDRLALAVAECYDVKIRPLFAHHYVEEYDHADFFINALNALGLDEASIISSRPLPGTLAILNFMRQCARRDPLQYAVCSGFLESTGSDRERARTFFAYVAKHYSPDTNDVVAPLVGHVQLDESYGHNNMMERIVERIGPVPIARASAALEAGALLVETLELWSTDIQRSYLQSPFTTRHTNTCYRPLIPGRRRSSVSRSS